MPDGDSAHPHLSRDPSSSVRPRPSLAVRILTRLRRKTLDEELARGADANASAALRLRAEQLRLPAERVRLANSLVEALGEARGGYLGAFRMKNRQRNDAIRESGDDLLALVERLRDNRPVHVRGAAMTARLLDASASALRHDGGPELQRAVRAALVALDATSSAAEDRAPAA
jgi:hypothetical protein